MLDPQAMNFAGLGESAYVRFSLLALSSIFFLVDPFAALPTFLAVTRGADAAERRKIALKASLTALVFLSMFALTGQYIFRLFGITLPAFEIAGGVILLLIGLDMLAAKRSPTQEVSGDAAAAAEKEDVGIVPMGIPMLAGPGAITTVMVLVGQARNRWQMAAILRGDCGDGGHLLSGAGELRPDGESIGRYGYTHPGADYGAAAGGAGGAVFCERHGGSGHDRQTLEFFL